MSLSFKTRIKFFVDSFCFLLAYALSSINLSVLDLEVKHVIIVRTGMIMQYWTVCRKSSMNSHEVTFCPQTSSQNSYLAIDWLT